MNTELLDERCAGVLREHGFAPCPRSGWFERSDGLLRVVHRDERLWQVFVFAQAVPKCGPGEPLYTRRMVPVDVAHFERWLCAVMATALAGLLHTNV